MSDRADFNRNWLTESPYNLGIFPAYDGFCEIVNDLLSRGYKPKNLKNNLKKIELENSIYYWYELKDGSIALGVSLYNMNEALVVKLTAKEPSLNKKPPFASDLYLAILNDTKKAIRIMSDNQLSEEGFKIWKRLYELGVCISVYCKNEKNAGQTYTLFDSFSDFKKYFSGTDKNMADYQYVLAKNKSNALGETIGYFGLRRIRELASVDLEDFDPTWNRVL